MADLTFNQVKATALANAIVADVANNDVVISLKALMGEASVALADAKVGEALSKLLDACASAQVAYNADAGNAKDLRSYPLPSVGTPIRDTTTGVYSSTFTYTTSVAIPLNKDTVAALEVA